MFKVIVNSVPHSGNHLVTSVLSNLGYNHSITKFTFYAGKPYFRRNQKAGINWRTTRQLGNIFLGSRESTCLVSVTNPSEVRLPVLRSLLGKIEDGEYLIAHMPFHDNSKEALHSMSFKSISIVRDPRDMMLSLIDHVKERPQHLMYSSLIEKTKERSQRIESLLTGFNDEIKNQSSIKEMYESMIAWEHFENNLVLKFEELVGPSGGGELSEQKLALYRIIKHLEMDIESEKEDLEELGVSSYGKTSTFRRGNIARWRDELSTEEKLLCRDYLSDILVRLNYEID